MATSIGWRYPKEDTTKNAYSLGAGRHFWFMPVKIIKDKEGKEHYVLVEEKPKEIAQKGDYWVRIPQKWWRKTLQGLKPIERCILISIRIAGAKNPSISWLARELNTTRKTIAKYLKILKGKGFL